MLASFAVFFEIADAFLRSKKYIVCIVMLVGSSFRIFFFSFFFLLFFISLHQQLPFLRILECSRISRKFLINSHVKRYATLYDHFAEDAIYDIRSQEKIISKQFISTQIIFTRYCDIYVNIVYVY